MIESTFKIKTIACILLAVAFGITGCAGPLALRATRHRYNETIQRTAKEELLLNLVRLKYRDIPTFLELQSLTTQFEFAKGASIDGSFTEGPKPAVLGVGASIGMSDRPTISYSKLQGADFVRRLISPMQEQTIVLLTQSGWSAARVLQITVQEMNNIPNAPRASGPTPTGAPVYEEFNQIVAVVRDLHYQGKLEFGYTEEASPLSAEIPETQVSGADLVSAAKEGYRFNKTKSGYQLTGKSSSLQLARKGDPDANVAVLSNMLNIDLVSKSEVTMSIQPRSLIGAMYYLSHVIQVPPEHYECGLIPVTMTEWGEPFDWAKVAGNIFEVRFSRKKPHCAFVAVPYRGYWYYIPDDSLTSKATFTLLAGLVELQAGGGASGAAPVLTLSVGR